LASARLGRDGSVADRDVERRGVEAAFSMPPDFDDRFQKGQFIGSIYGHGGSINEPYGMLRLYQGQSVAVLCASGEFRTLEERGIRQDRG